MAPILGFSTLLLVFTVGIFLPFFNFFSYKKHQIKDLTKINSLLVLALLLAAITSQFSLIYSFVISDYSVANVHQNSHHLKPLIYKISGAWGNHEGSMLLLISILCGYLFAFNFISQIDGKSKLIINSAQGFIIANFAAFTAFTSNPFERIFPTPTSGLELNPLLQDIGLALHPPMLYTGYIGFALVFSFIIAALLREKLDLNLIQKLKPFLFFSYAFLTIGIALGSWWAYRELGWGGYWFWDPVENISLMPWICATALIHALRLSEIKNTAQNWSCFLAIFTFILCLLGIFLTRSGILTSVHSFAIDASRGFFIIALIFIIGGSALLIFGAKIGKITNGKLTKSKKILSAQNLIFVNNYFLIFALLIILLGTLYPIFSKAFFNQFTSIGAPYYNQIFTILIIPFLSFLIAAGKFKNYSIRLKSIILLITIALTSLAYKAEALQMIILFLSILSLLTASSYKFNIMNLSHFGFSMIICGVILTSSFSEVKEVNLRENESLKIGDFSLKFENNEYYSGKNFIARQGNFSINRGQKKIGQLKPQLRFYPISNQTTNEASIRHGILGDLYLVIGTKDEDDNYAIRAYFKPFIYLLWLGSGLIFFAAILQVFRSLQKQLLKQESAK